MLIFGGHAARLRGSPFRSGDSDIDLFATSADLDALVDHLSQRWPSAMIARHNHPVYRRAAITAARYHIPSWRLIDVEIVNGAILDRLKCLSDNVPADLFGMPCRRTSLVTDCVIKLAAAEHVPNVHPKHRADLDHIGFDLGAASDAHLAFYAEYCTLLTRRYGGR